MPKKSGTPKPWGKGKRLVYVKGVACLDVPKKMSYWRRARYYTANDTYASVKKMLVDACLKKDLKKGSRDLPVECDRTTKQLEEIDKIPPPP